MRLAELPPELVLAIAEALQNEHDVNTRVRTCRRFHQALNTFLYQYNVRHSGGSGMYRASFTGNASAVGKFLDQGADLNASPSGAPLISAAIRGHYNVVELLQDEELAALLLNAGADINLGGYSGNTPLSELLEQGRIETVKWLFYHGAKVELDDPYGGTALTISSENGDEEMNTEFAKVLLERGANMECRDSAEDTPLSKATRIGLLESATLLLDHGANVETRNQDEQTPLFIAAFFGSGRTPLSVAIESNNDELRAVLVENGATHDANDAESSDSSCWEIRALIP
ncbi:hypothetical protein H105_06343 [Trichophyton soudanense CBS 452.61]|uniref:Uncharacterized protein n=2 Tax=Trichophyton TaxID=5550 RepID=A0A022XM20_TRISD|nr:hypothetical protein H105_06343 [Trichophyton soudanense CBS 452.61]